MRKLYLVFGMALIFCLSGCNDWLDVRQETEQKEEEQFATYKGFCDALTGCYMTLGDKAVYGEKLTMSNIESLANLWNPFTTDPGTERCMITRVMPPGRPCSLFGRSCLM